MSFSTFIAFLILSFLGFTFSSIGKLSVAKKNTVPSILYDRKETKLEEISPNFIDEKSVLLSNQFEIRVLKNGFYKSAKEGFLGWKVVSLREIAESNVKRNIFSIIKSNVSQITGQAGCASPNGRGLRFILKGKEIDYLILDCGRIIIFLKGKVVKSASNYYLTEEGVKQFDKLIESIPLSAK